MTDTYVHVPVLVREVVEWLKPGISQLAVLIDCTLGGGGHSLALLEAAPDLKVVGIDRDDGAIEAARRSLRSYEDRVQFFKANFAEAPQTARRAGFENVGAILWDLGVSSPQLDRADRGFRFRDGGPLDMRMDPQDEITARDVVNTYPVARLAKVISRYGEERFARRISSAIAKRREQRPFETTEDLAEVVKLAIPAATRRRGQHPARRTFQALRIEVNQELVSLETGLGDSLRVLIPGGRAAVISYHSLEDRIVKRTFEDMSRGCKCPKDLPVCVCGAKAELRILTRKPVRPSTEEIERNPRADSARLRVAERLAAA